MPRGGPKRAGLSGGELLCLHTAVLSEPGMIQGSLRPPLPSSYAPLVRCCFATPGAGARYFRDSWAGPLVSRRFSLRTTGTRLVEHISTRRALSNSPTKTRGTHIHGDSGDLFPPAR